MLWREPMAACRFRRNRARRKGFRYDHPSISSLQRRRARPGGSDASMTCSTMDANRSVQDASHVAGQRARRKGGIKRPLTINKKRQVIYARDDLTPGQRENAAAALRDRENAEKGD